ncbi:hypothetical protein ZIOFF_032993 [Zingiber officinale]|uniref:TF-B3 domain-containing protein n=1 Tax=Zingiber officinale TaxID=94328 RepID=A0A8J5GJA3_ZINOF|nr:hypothetical protein ZIOFF_036558 [Zingiber officinale]KAG6507642.1 hypothetical protein ZIOFF_032993 [Zingiber officinale]
MSSEPREGSGSNSVMWGGGGCRCGQGPRPSSPAAGDTAASNEPAVDGQDRHKGVMLRLYDDRWDDAQVYDAHGRDCIWPNAFLSKSAAAAATYENRVALAPATKLAPGGLRDDVVAVEMFTKELTPSDVGKLNRLVIPKKYATQHFSHVEGSAQDELLMKFVDKEGHWWAFRYCYWKSSQSYVFTKGWNRFVKEKRLCAKDTVAFYQCNERNGLRQPYCLIDIIKHVENKESKDDDRKCREDHQDSSWSTSEGVEIGLGLNFKRRVRHQGEEGELKRKMKAKYEDGEVVLSMMSPKMENKKRLKLFGEWIKIE